MTISEVSKKYDLSQDTLRYYERVGIIPKVHRTASGLRDYTPEDCSWVELAKCLRSAGMSVEAISEYVRLSRMGDDTIAQRRDLLVHSRRQMAEQLTHMEEAIGRLDHKILLYEEAVKTGMLPWN